MKEQFTAYLKSIGMSDVLVKRIETIHGFYQSISPGEITDVFVGEHLEADGNRAYESAWFFSQNYFMEAKTFTTKDNFDLVPVRNRVRHWRVEKQDYDFVNATEKSRMVIEIRLIESLGGIFRASKENCDFLRDVFRKHILPNIVCIGEP